MNEQCLHHICIHASFSGKLYQSCAAAARLFELWVCPCLEQDPHHVHEASLGSIPKRAGDPKLPTIKVEEFFVYIGTSVLQPLHNAVAPIPGSTHQWRLRW